MPAIRHARVAGRKLDRGAQFVALGVILILVAAGVGMFVYAVLPVG
jgi:hypothetical protein